ncbi:peptidoglycan-binding protein [Roseibium aggregatum]|uniref:Peptidoglycan-binding protein n=1 Tax=Roseibium aggregatum TaxID=187304 RepID=A0A926S8N3_9HYPH|nr:peptidoglycan-binding domain-containing protein [Roseibium aggregatum]MBD1545214.1 peptidoglycan-binding protein [Roseibium aggregatum]
MSRQRRQQEQEEESSMAGRVGGIARDNPVAAGGTVVMALTGCLIVANALGLQSGRHPAPLFMTRDWANDTPAMIEPEDRRGTAMPQASQLVLDLQTALRRQDLYNGPLDGISGPATEQAIRMYERAQGQVETGEPTEALLARITLQGAAPVPAVIPVPRKKPSADGGEVLETVKTDPAAHTPEAASGAAPDTAPETDPQIVQIQKLLSDLGYGPLQADGVMGENTEIAIKRFQLNWDLPITGKVSPDLVARLESVSGRKIGN